MQTFQPAGSTFPASIRPGAPYRNQNVPKTISPIQQQQQQQQQIQQQLQQQQQQQQQQKQRVPSQQRPPVGSSSNSSGQPFNHSTSQNPSRPSSANSAPANSNLGLSQAQANGQSSTPSTGGSGGGVGGGSGGGGGGPGFSGAGYQRSATMTGTNQIIKPMQQMSNQSHSSNQQQRSSLNDIRNVSGNNISLDQQQQQQQQQPLPQRISAGLANPSSNYGHSNTGNGQQSRTSTQQPRPSVFGNATGQQQRANTTTANLTAHPQVNASTTNSAQSTMGGLDQSSISANSSGQQGNNQAYHQGVGLMQLAAGVQPSLSATGSSNTQALSMKRKSEDSPFNQNPSTRSRIGWFFTLFLRQG